MLERTDIVSKTKKPIDQLFRVVRLPNGRIEVECDRKLFGRGAYVSKTLASIIEAQKKNLLSRHLKCQVSDEVYLELISLLGRRNHGEQK